MCTQSIMPGHERLKVGAKLRVRYKTRRGTATYSVLPYTKHRESPGGCL